MDEDQLSDMRQFIAATVSQATAGMATKDDITRLATKDDITRLATKDDITRLEQKVDDLDLKVDTISEALNEHLDEHEERLVKLEQQLAQ